MTGRGKADCLSNLGNSKLEEEREGGGEGREHEKNAVVKREFFRCDNEQA